MNKLPLFSAPLLRIGISFVFVWFGVNQIIDPTSWFAYVPDYVIHMTHLSVLTIVYLNAIFEIVCGSMLLFGLCTRVAAVLLALHIIDITFVVGMDSIGVRDCGIAIATVAVFLNGTDWFSLDRYRNDLPTQSTETHI